VRATKILIWVLAALALWWPAVPAAAEPTTPAPGGSGVIDAAEFVALLQAHDGGVLVLDADVVLDADPPWWASYGSIYAYLTAPTVVVLGDHGITVTESTMLVVDGPGLVLTGSGAVTPLLTLAGMLDAANLQIEATGVGAVAVRTVGTVNLVGLRILAPGEDAVAVSAAGQLLIARCEVVGGRSAVVGESADTDVVIDGSTVSPDVPGTQIIGREAVPQHRIQENGVTVPVGLSQEDVELTFKFDHPVLHYYLLDVERQAAAESHPQPGVCEVPPLDTSVPGEHVVRCWPVDVPPWFPIDLPDVEIPLHVIDPSKPFLTRAMPSGDGISVSYYARMWDAESLTLWYSTDDGESWQSLGEVEDAFVGNGSAFAPSEKLPHNRVYLFRLEVDDGEYAGLSNTLAFSFYDSDPDSGDVGGDRTGADRFPIADPDLPGDGQPSGPPFGAGPGSPPASPDPGPTIPPAASPPPSKVPSSPGTAGAASAGSGGETGGRTVSGRPLVNVIADPGSSVADETDLPDDDPTPGASQTSQPFQPLQPSSPDVPSVKPEDPNPPPGESPAAPSAIPWLVAATGFAVLALSAAAFWVRRRRL
jgi:hypothetical protein